MPDKQLKLVGEPATPQPTFPRTNIQFLPNGFVISTMIAEDISIFSKAFLGQDALDFVEALVQWRKQYRQQVQMVQDIQRSKLH